MMCATGAMIFTADCRGEMMLPLGANDVRPLGATERERMVSPYKAKFENKLYKDIFP
jgi:hypothetical protein